MVFVCYPRCTTCQKAQKWLDAQGLAYQVRHIKDDNPTAEELKAWWARSAAAIRILPRKEKRIPTPVCGLAWE